MTFLSTIGLFSLIFSEKKKEGEKGREKKRKRKRDNAIINPKNIFIQCRRKQCKLCNVVTKKKVKIYPVSYSLVLYRSKMISLAASSRASFAASATFGGQSHFAANRNRQVTWAIFSFDNVGIISLRLPTRATNRSNCVRSCSAATYRGCDKDSAVVWQKKKKKRTGCNLTNAVCDCIRIRVHVSSKQTQLREYVNKSLWFCAPAWSKLTQELQSRVRGDSIVCCRPVILGIQRTIRKCK